MRRWLLALPLLAGALLAPGLSGASPTQTTAIVASVYDGDTLTLTSGYRVRLVQIDTPELGSGECYSRAARTALLSVAPVGTRIGLESDPRLDRVDRYGRLLRYVHRGSLNVNVQLVKRGDAAPYFYDGDRGKFAAELLSDARRAKAARRGLWGACPRTRLDPYRAVDTGTSGPPASVAPAALSSSGCDPSYAGACVPPSRRISTATTCARSVSRSPCAWSAPIPIASTATTTATTASNAAL